MDRKKMRSYPPVIVSCVALTAFTVISIFSIGSNATSPQAETNAETLQNSVDYVQKLPTGKETVNSSTEEQVKNTASDSEEMFSAEESTMLVKIAMAEAEGESVEGKALVMLTVLNRVLSDSFPDTIEGVIFQPGQFSVTAESHRYWTAEPDKGCYEALELIESGWDESNGALYFESCENSSWHSENLEFLYQVGNHRFYK